MSLAWLFFRAESMSAAWAMLHRIATGPVGTGGITALALATVIDVLGPAGVAPFIYFRF